MNKNLKKIVNERQDARDIVKQILDHSSSENLRFCIILELAMNLENTEALREIVNIVKKHRENINIDEKNDNNLKDKPKLII